MVYIGHDQFAVMYRNLFVLLVCHYMFVERWHTKQFTNGAINAAINN